MGAISSAKRVAVTLALTGALVACSATSGSSVPNSPGLVAANPSELANLPDLGLKNVQTETSNARGAMVDATGGTVTATGADGSVFSLTIPAGALDKSTQISLYPVSSVATLPQGSKLVAGVQFAPDGLQLAVPGTLTITLPSGTDATKLGGLAWSGDDTDPHPYPAILANGSLQVPVFHFSGGGVGNLPDPPLVALSCTSETDMEINIGGDWQSAMAGAPTGKSGLVKDLKDCWVNFVAPALTAQSKVSTPDNMDAAEAAKLAYDFWRTTIDKGVLFFGSFMVAPELANSKPLAVAFLKNWYATWNAKCRADAASPHDAVLDAFSALKVPHVEAASWGVDSAANGLDYETLLNNLCVQVVIDPSRNFSAAKPGDDGNVTVPVGYSVAGGPVLHDEPIDVRLTLPGQSAPFADGSPDQSGTFTAQLTWPDGVDPVKIDILASLEYDRGFLSPVARFDEITQSSGKKVDIAVPTGIWAGLRPLVWPSCQEMFMAADSGDDWTFTLSGPATVTKTDGDHIYFRGTGDGTISFTAHSPTETPGSGTASAYISTLAGNFQDAAATTAVFIGVQLDAEGILTYEVRQLVGSRQTDDWTNLTASQNELSGTDALGNAFDITISGNQLTGTIAGAPVTLQRQCGP
ncbi:MAG TPA: hypothetical protein VKR30_01310 [Candidatus Limnocylindrales bacterium]|nr:hypothetical protein [Candidatus Limnocylindrales bacterium]